MGMFKDMRSLHKAGKEETKKRGGSFKMMKDGLSQANEAVQQVQSDQALAEKLANEGVDGQATINSMVATGKQVNYQPELQFELSVERERPDQRRHSRSGRVSGGHRPATARCGGGLQGRP